MRGKIHHLDDTIVVPTWHPSYMLRRPMSRNDAVEDMKLVKEIIEKS